jgi:hypothetical protein
MLGEPSQWDAAGLTKRTARRSKETPGSVSLLVTIMRSYIRFHWSRRVPTALLHAIHLCSDTAFDAAAPRRPGNDREDHRPVRLTGQ